MDAFRQKIADQIERQKEIKKEQIWKIPLRPEQLQIYSLIPEEFLF